VLNARCSSNAITCAKTRKNLCIRLLAEVGKREKEKGKRRKGKRNVPFPFSPSPFPLSGTRFLIFARGLLIGCGLTPPAPNNKSSSLHSPLDKGG
jgi:hypothetical protein